jgi:predicted membrane protein
MATAAYEGEMTHLEIKTKKVRREGKEVKIYTKLKIHDVEPATSLLGLSPNFTFP